MTDYREDFAKQMGLPISARFIHAEADVRRMTAEIMRQHPTHTPDMARGRALARLDAQQHQRSQAKSFIVTKDHNWRRKVEVAAFILMFLFCLVMATRAHGQSTTVQGRAKGTTAANTATVTANDANHNGIDVNVLNAGSGGTASSFGAAFPATGTAAGFSDGVNMLPATLDASGFLKINCAAGCVAGGSFTDSSAFTFGTTSVGNMSAVVDDVATNTVAENSAGAVRMNANRILYMDISKTAANTIAIKVDGSAVTQPVSGTVAVTQSTSPWVISFTAPQHVIIDSSASIAVTGPLTDTQLRASAVPISATQLPAALDGSGFLKVHEQGTASVSQSGTWTVQPGNTANTTAWKVDGSAVTQPISGTVTAVQGTGTNLHMVCDSGCTAGGSFLDSSAFTFGTTAVSNTSFVVDDVATNTVAENSAGAARMNTNRILYVDLSKTAANTNKLLVTPDSVALPANQSVNVSQINAVTPLMGNGVTGTGSQRVTVASDNTPFAVKIDQTTPGTTNLVALAANQSVNVAQINGVTPLMGNGTTGTGSQRVTIASDNTAFSVNATDVGTLADNGAAAATNRIGTLPAITQTSYENGTASTQGRNAALNTGTDGLLWTANLPAIRPASYVASSAFAGSSTTDNAVMPGNASNTVLVTMVKVSCTQTTAGSITLTLVKRSAADTVGTSASMTAVPDDSNYASAVSAPLSYTGTGPTVGTPVGNVDNVKLGCEATSTAAPQDIYILNRRQKPIVLRGTAQQLAVNAGGAITGGNITVTFEWIETATILP